MTTTNNIGSRRIKRRFLTSARKKAISVSLALMLALSMPFAYATEGGDIVTSEPVAEAQAAPATEPEASPEPAAEPTPEPEPASEPAQEEPKSDEPSSPADEPEQVSQPEGQGGAEAGAQVPATPAADEPADEGEEGEAGQVEPAEEKPLYVEASGSFFEGSDALAVKLQVLKDGSFQDVRELSLADSQKSDPVERLEAGTYRVVLSEDVEGAETAVKVTVDGVEREADYERGFEFDPEKGSSVKLTVNVTEKAPEPEPNPEPAPAPESVESGLTFKVVGSASARLVHKNGAEVTIGAGETVTLTGVINENVQIYGTTPSASNVTITVTSPVSGAQVGLTDTYNGVTEFFREVSFTGSDRVVTIDASEAAVVTYVRSSSARLMAPMARAGSQSQPEVGDVYSGKATVVYVDLVPNTNEMVNYTEVSFTSGILAAESNAIVYCDNHGAARPLATNGNVWNYWYSVESVDKASGKVTGKVYLEGTGAYVPSDNYQTLSNSNYSIKRTYGGYIAIDKDSSNTAITNNNPLYSLERAEYGIYSNAACTTLVDTLVTDASGKDTSTYLNAGTYYVKETKAPKGYCLDEKTYTVKVSGGTTYVNGGKVYDEPGNDPAYMFAGKIDKETTQNMPQGSASLEGAEFTVKYYAGYFATAEEAEASGALMKTWVVATDEDGYANLSEEFRVGGDDFYYNEFSQVVVPLGTIVLQETKAPEGYLVNDQVFVRQVTEDGITGSNTVTYNAPIVPEQIIRGGISVTKTLEGGANEELEGIAFFIYSSAGEKMTFEDAGGNVTDRLVLDANGFASTAEDALVFDTYTIVEDESSVPDDIIWYGDAQGEGSAVVGEVSVSEPLTVYNVDVVNYKKPTFDLIKVDGDSLRDEGSEESAAKVAHSQWKLEFSDNGTWVEIGTYETDENGKVEFGGQAISKWGTYCLTEVLPADVDREEGYMYPHDAYEADSVEFTVDADMWAKFEAGVTEGEEGDSWSYQMVDGKPALVHGFHNWHYREIEVVKNDQETGDPVEGTSFALYRYIGEGVPAEMEDGYRAESHELYATDPGFGFDEALWEKVAEGKTDENGSHLFRGLTFGYYMTVEELPADGYAYWWESAESSWATYFFEVGELEQHQVQIYENMKITVETTVDKSTIERTSAGFTSLPDQNVAYDNVNVEQYRYDVAFTNGSTNVRADQYSVIDECEFTELGLRLATLTTPTVANDTDGCFNLWYQSNMTDAGAAYSSASATATNPENEMADGSDRIPTTGWKLWAEGISADGRQTLSVEDLGLAEGEYVTRLMLEFGSVEVGFATTAPLSYMVYSTVPLAAETVIPNTATSHITRNWNGGAEGDGLFDDAVDKVETRVIDTFTVEDGTSQWTASGKWFGSSIISQTGDGLGLLAVGLAAAVALSVGALALAMRRGAARRGSDN